MRDDNSQQQFEQHQEQEFKEELDRLEKEGKWGERNHLLLSMFPNIGNFKKENQNGKIC
jgi:hypothetical protein